MGSIFLQVGQCGCQIGIKLNPFLSNSYYCTRICKPHKVHSIMIDSQPKVLKPFLDKTPVWLDSQNIKFFQHGRGNNWSYGYLHEIPNKKINTQIMTDYRQFSNKSKDKILYNYVQQNKKISQFVIDRFRKQLQTVDCPMIINIIGSLGGGTGSGIGTKMVQVLHQQFNMDIYSHSVLPNMSGQTPLQIYNCLLSLSVIQQHSTAIFPIQNQKKLQYFRTQNQQYFQIDSLDKINQSIANNLSKLIKINDIQGYGRFYNDIINTHTLSSQMKYFTLLTSNSYQKSNDPTNQCFQDLFKQLKIYNQDYSISHNKQTQIIKRQRFLSGQLISIAKQNIEFQKIYKKKLHSLLNPYEENKFQYSHINSRGTHFSSLLTQKIQKTQKNNKITIKQRIQLILIMNHSNIVRYLKYLTQRGKIKFQSKAYLWHYQYVDIQQAIQNVQKTIDQYQFFTHNQLY